MAETETPEPNKLVGVPEPDPPAGGPHEDPDAIDPADLTPGLGGTSRTQPRADDDEPAGDA